MKTFRPVVLGLLGAVGAAACGGGGGGPAGPTAVITITGGDPQVGAAGQQLATPLEVTVKDQSGNPLASVTVIWAAASGGGSVTPGAATGSDGKATATRTLGPDTVTQTTTASVSGASAVTFTHIAQIQGATQMQLNAGQNQSDTVLSTLSTDISVLVRNQNNLPVQNVQVSWTASGNGKVSGAPTATSNTDASGIASVTYKLGSTAGTQNVQAAVGGLIGSPVIVPEVATAGNETQMALNAGDNQCGQPSSELTTPHSVIVRDAHANPKSGVTVDWVVPPASGTVNPTQSVTGPTGVASTKRTVGANAGTYTDTATVAGLSPVPFTATVSTTIVDVTVNNDFFATKDATVPRCGTVRWTWVPSARTHTVTFENTTALGSGSGSEGAGFVFTKVFDVAPGLYRYRCTIHSTNFTSGMVGTVTVQ